MRYIVRQREILSDYDSKLTKKFDDLNEAIEYCGEIGRTWGVESITTLYDDVTNKCIFSCSTNRSGYFEGYI